jgi:hypothetical protein
MNKEEKLINITIAKRYTDLELTRTVEVGEIIEVTEDRADKLAKLGLVKNREDEKMALKDRIKLTTNPPLKTPKQIEKEVKKKATVKKATPKKKTATKKKTTAKKTTKKRGYKVEGSFTDGKK